MALDRLFSDAMLTLITIFCCEKKHTSRAVSVAKQRNAKGCGERRSRE
jgi:hypothetical protein